MLKNAIHVILSALSICVYHVSNIFIERYVGYSNFFFLCYIEKTLSYHYYYKSRHKHYSEKHQTVHLTNFMKCINYYCFLY